MLLNASSWIYEKRQYQKMCTLITKVLEISKSYNLYIKIKNYKNHIYNHDLELATKNLKVSDELFVKPKL